MAECIDREALLHDIEQSVVYTARGKITSAEMRGARKIIERIKCAPAVEPIYIHEPTKSEFKRMAAQLGYEQVVHGRWIPVENGAWAECSECGEGYDVSDNGGMPAFKLYRNCYKYCPNCGARMDGGESDNG